MGTGKQPDVTVAVLMLRIDLLLNALPVCWQSERDGLLNSHIIALVMFVGMQSS